MKIGTDGRPGFLKRALPTLFLWSMFLGLAEVGLRVREAWRARDPGSAVGELHMCEANGSRLWQYKANFREAHQTPEFRMTVRTNDWRLRDAEPDLAAALRILVIGGSFTFGWGVDEGERYSEVVQRAVSRALPGTSVGVLNAGHWSYGVDQQLLLLRELLPRFRPQVVVQGLYAPQVITLESHDWVRGTDGEIVEIRNPGIRVDGEGRLRFTNDWLERPALPSRVLTTASRLWLNYRLARTAMTGDLVLFDPAADVHERGWTMTRDTLGLTGRLLAGAGVRWIAMGIPRDVQASPREWSQAARRQLERPGVDLQLPTRRLASLVDRAGGDWLDLLPEITRRDSSLLYFEVDPHWRPAGHELVGRLLAERILAFARSGVRPELRDARTPVSGTESTP
jgi:hypothetical protein